MVFEVIFLALFMKGRLSNVMTEKGIGEFGEKLKD